MNTNADNLETPTLAKPSGGGKFALLLIILIAAGLAGWGVFRAISAKDGYEPALRRFAEAAAKNASVEVRLTDDDRQYHREFHRKDEGRMSTLPQAVIQGYERCTTCSPPTMPRPPRRPLAWAGSVGTFGLVLFSLVFLSAKKLGLKSIINGPPNLDEPPPSHFAELSDEFELLRKDSLKLLNRLAVPSTPEAHGRQAEIFAIAALRWAARWTHRQVSAMADIENLEDMLMPPEAPEIKPGGKGANAPVGKSDKPLAGPSERVRWLEQQFEYRQLLWKAADESSAKILINEGRHLLDRLIRDAQSAELPRELVYDDEILNHLSDVLRRTVEFFHRHYANDLHFRRGSSPATKAVHH